MWTPELSDPQTFNLNLKLFKGYITETRKKAKVEDSGRSHIDVPAAQQPAQPSVSTTAVVAVEPQANETVNTPPPISPARFWACRS